MHVGALLLLGVASVLLARAETASADDLSFDCATVEHGGRRPYGVIVGDWNGDGRPDLAVSNLASSSVSILLGTGKGRFERVAELSVGRVPRPLAAADLDRDGDLDLVVGHVVPSFTWVFLGDGRGGFEYGAQYTSGDAPFDVALADLDGDGNLDLVVANETNPSFSPPAGKIGIHPGRGDGSFGEPTVLEAGRYPSGLVVAELDGRPGLDLAVSNWGSDTVSLLFRAADGLRPGPTLDAGLDNPYGLASGDLDGDGWTDLAVPGVRGKVRVFYGAGGGAFSDGGLLEVGSGVRFVTAADVDGDGRLDLVTADPGDDRISLLRNLGGRRFAPAQAVAVGKHARMVRAADLDGDGRTDLVVTNQRQDNLSVCLQRGGKTSSLLGGAHPVPEGSAGP